MSKKMIVIFVILSIIASALNYLMYPILSRILSPNEYINITVSLSLFTQITAFLSSITAITIGLSKNERDNQKNEKIEQLQTVLSRMFFALAIIFLVLSPIIMGSIRTPILFAIPIALMMLFTVPISIISGYLNGKKLMIQLGILGLLSAVIQFTIGFIVAFVCRNGLLTMLSMAIAQLITIAIASIVFSNNQLPKIYKSLKAPIKLDNSTKKLISYTTLASIAVLAISLIQIIDLFVMQVIPKADIKFYTDIYVISRVVFFAGMIFVWPFLGEINMDNHRLNYRPFFKLIGYFSLISLSAIFAIFFFGKELAEFLFGANYNIDLIRSVSALSILYKYFLLIIISIVLYFVVLRSNKAIWLSLTTSMLVGIYYMTLNKNLDMPGVLLLLDSVACIVALAGILLLLSTPIDKSKW